MKKSIVIALCLVLVVMTACCVLSACNSSELTVTFKDGDKVLSTMKVKVGESFTLPADPQKANYKFSGWYTDADLSNLYVADKLMNELTLYAKFIPDELTIAINAKGGTVDPKVVTAKAGEAYTLPVPTKEGYDFAGYIYYDYNDEERAFPTTGTYNVVDENGNPIGVRVEATWTLAKHTVAFMDGDTVIKSYNAEIGSTVYAPNPTKEGYDLAGWTKADGTVVNAASYAVEGDAVYTAKWTAKTYTVKYNVAGGTAIAPITVTYGEAYTLTAAEKDGYTFLGYVLDEEEFPLTGTFTKTSDVTVLATYAQNTVNVTYVDAAETAYVATIAQYAKAAQRSATAKVGHTFVRWAAEENGEEAYDFDQTVSADLTLYAVYQANQYTITVINMPSANTTVAYGSQYALPEDADVEYPAWAIADSFAGYTMDEEEFAATGTYEWANNIVVTANFERDPGYGKSTVTVIGLSENVSFEVTDGETAALQLAALNTAKTGYAFLGWKVNGQDFAVDTAIEQNITIYANYQANTYHIYLMDGETQKGDIEVTYDGAYEIDTEEYNDKRGYELVGLRYSGNAFSAEGTYTIASDISVYIQYNPIQRDVTFYVDGEEYDATTVNQYAKVSKPETDPEKDGYNFKGWSKQQQSYVAYDFNAEVENNTNLYAFFDAKSVKVTIVKYDTTTTELTATYGVALDLPVPAARNGYRFLGYERTNGEAFTAPVLADYDAAFTIREKWEQLESPDKDDSEKTFVVKDNYYKERASLDEEFTYVFLTGYSYDLSGIKAIEGADAYFDISIENKVATLDTKQNVGSFTMTVTRDMDGTDYVYTRKVKVVNNTTVTYGTDYTKIWVNTQQSGNANFQVARSEANVMAAGVDNFVFDISIATNAGSSESPDYVALPFANANIDVVVKDGDQVVADSLYNVNTLTGAITFDASLVGKTVTITLTPRYAASTNVKTFKLVLNNGVNVYTNTELKSRYSDLSVHQINILRNITAELNADDYMAGHGKNIENVTLSSTTLEGVDTGTPQNDYSHGVYTRITTDTSDTMKINGNFFAIDGSKLPYIDNRYDQYGASGSKFTTGDSYRIANVQIGIFLYRNCTLDNDGTTLARYQGGTLTMDNLLVSGNNVMSLSDASQDLGDGKVPLLKMSAAYLGIVCRGGTVNLDNVHVKNTSIGIFTDGGIDGYTGNDEIAFNSDKHAVVINMDNCRVTESWANDVYGYYLTKFTINNTVLSATSGGAAIALDDKPASKATNDLQIEVNIDYYTAANIQNWVTGLEAWFVAYGHSSTALGVKTTINDSVSGNGLTDLDSTSQMMNFAIFARSGGNYENSEWDADPQGAPSVKINVTNIPAALIMYAMHDTVAAMAQGYGISEEMAATQISNQMASNGIFCWAEGQNAQMYLVYSMGSRNSVMTVGIPLYIQGTQPR